MKEFKKDSWLLQLPIPVSFLLHPQAPEPVPMAFKPQSRFGCSLRWAMYDTTHCFFKSSVTCSCKWEFPSLQLIHRLIVDLFYSVPQSPLRCSVYARLKCKCRVICTVCTEFESRICCVGLGKEIKPQSL